MRLYCFIKSILLCHSMWVFCGWQISLFHIHWIIFFLHICSLWQNVLYEWNMVDHLSKVGTLGSLCPFQISFNFSNLSMIYRRVVPKGSDISNRLLCQYAVGIITWPEVDEWCAPREQIKLDNDRLHVSHDIDSALMIYFWILRLCN